MADPQVPRRLESLVPPSGVRAASYLVQMPPGPDRIFANTASGGCGDSPDLDLQRAGRSRNPKASA